MRQGNVILIRQFGLFLLQTNSPEQSRAPANCTHNNVCFQWTLRSDVDPTTAGTVIREQESPVSAERTKPRLPTSVFESTSVAPSERECLLPVGNLKKKKGNVEFQVQKRPLWRIFQMNSQTGNEKNKTTRRAKERGFAAEIPRSPARRVVLLYLFPI